MECGRLVLALIQLAIRKPQIGYRPITSPLHKSGNLIAPSLFRVVSSINRNVRLDQFYFI